MVWTTNLVTREVCELISAQPVSDVWHLLLILIHITAEDDKSEALEQQRSLLLLQLFT